MPLARARLALAGVLLALGLGACAPPPPGSLESLELTARRAAERREARWASSEGEAIVRVDGRATGRLPALDLHLRLAAPDRVRLQFRWVLGVLADVVARGDTLVAWVPSERLGVTVPGLGDTLGLHEPARFLTRALTAAWVAPHEAWRTGVLDSAGARLAWTEPDGDAWTLRVDRRGRPVVAQVQRAEHRITMTASRWEGVGAEAHPTWLELVDERAGVRIRVELEGLSPVRHSRDDAFALELPREARSLEWDDVIRLLTLGGNVR